MPKIIVIHGPNLNLLGLRRPEVYGTKTLAQINEEIEEFAKAQGVEVRIFQSNEEGKIVEAIHGTANWADAIVINPGAYSHYSIAIRDALEAVKLPTIEVHISNIYAREQFRHHSVIAPIAWGQITGLGELGYLLAIQAAKSIVSEY